MGDSVRRYRLVKWILDLLRDKAIRSMSDWGSSGFALLVSLQTDLMYPGCSLAAAQVVLTAGSVAVKVRGCAVGSRPSIGSRRTAENHPPPAREVKLLVINLYLAALLRGTVRI